MTLGYYPFGLKQKGYNNVVSSQGNSVAQKYKYNGKELQEELDLNLYDYGRRNYDPAIARFITMDRFAAKYLDKSPYHYANNSPLIYVDKQGDSIKFAVTRVYTGATINGGSTTEITSNNDVGETILDSHDGGSYNSTSTEVDATFTIQERFSPFLDPSSSNTFKSNNLGFDTEAFAHEDGHADQFKDEINNGTFTVDIRSIDGNGALQTTTLTGKAQDILNDVYSNFQTSTTNALNADAASSNPWGAIQFKKMKKLVIKII